LFKFLVGCFSGATLHAHNQVAIVRISNCWTMYLCNGKGNAQIVSTTKSCCEITILL